MKITIRNISSEGKILSETLKIKEKTQFQDLKKQIEEIFNIPEEQQLLNIVKGTSLVK